MAEPTPTTSTLHELEQLDATLESEQTLSVEVEEHDALDVAVDDGSDALAAEVELAAVLEAEVGELQGLVGPAGPPGPIGPRGLPGAVGGKLIKRSRGSLSGGVAVALDDAEYVRAASCLERADALLVVGVSAHAVSEPDADVEIVEGGLLEDSAWTFTPMRPVYVGAGGRLVQTLPDGFAFARIVGLALSPTHLHVQLQTPILQGG